MKTTRSTLLKITQSTLLGVTLATLFTACAGPRYAVQPVLNSELKSHHQQGMVVLESDKKHVVTVRPLQNQVRAKERLKFLVAVGNQGQEPFEFSLDDVQVSDNDQPLKLYSYEEQKREIENAAALMALAAGINAASASINAAMPQTTYANLSVPGGGSMNYQLTTFNPANAAAQQAAIQANLSSEMQAISAGSAAQLNSLSAVLRQNTVKPGLAAGGVVMVQAVKTLGSHEIKLHVQAEQEDHEFTFTMEKLPK
ncbi:MAG TPA: hypothetical protein VGH19_18495 [Verrucomicrobiae bacterium]